MKIPDANTLHPETKYKYSSAAGNSILNWLHLRATERIGQEDRLSSGIEWLEADEFERRRSVR
jgi:hypothetical protein